MSENGEIYTAGKYFTLPLALTGWTNSTSEDKSRILVTLVDLGPPLLKRFGKLIF